MIRGLIYVNYQCSYASRGSFIPFKAHFNLPRCQSQRGEQSALPYLAIIKCFGTMWGIYKRWSRSFSLPRRSKWKYWLFFRQTTMKHVNGLHHEAPGWASKETFGAVTGDGHGRKSKVSLTFSFPFLFSIFFLMFNWFPPYSFPFSTSLCCCLFQ